MTAVGPRSAPRRGLDAESDEGSTPRSSAPTRQTPSSPPPRADAEEDLESWNAKTQDALREARKLRMELRKTKERSAYSQHADLKAPGERPCGVATTALEDRLKRRQSTEKNIADNMSNQMDTMAHTAFNLGNCMHRLQRESGAIWASKNVNEKRLELRSKRPPSEAVRDGFQESLEQEQTELDKVHQQLADEMKMCEDMASQIEAAKADMHQNKLTLHLDRGPRPKQFLKGKQELEEAAGQLCAQSEKLTRRAEVIRDQAKAHTTTAMNKRMAEVVKMRRHLEKEINDTRCSIDEAAYEMRRMKKLIRDKEEAKEKKHKGSENGSEFDFEAFHSRANANSMGYEALSQLRAKIKGSAYTGHAGRQLDVVFGRFDTDRSGELDEDEVRRALRRTLKIPPTVITDAEISALCKCLDSDNSGSVSIKEMCEFLDADIDVKALHDENEQITATHGQLSDVLELLIEDLRLKTVAWKIDRSCSTLTAIKGLELDTLPPPIEKAPADKRLKPLEPRVIEKVRHRLKAAAREAGGGLEEILNNYTKKTKGQLEPGELRKAVRAKLKIPSYTVSDAEIASLCAMLDSTSNGCASVSEVLEFVGVDSEEECAEPTPKSERKPDREKKPKREEAEKKPRKKQGDATPREGSRRQPKEEEEEPWEPEGATQPSTPGSSRASSRRQPGEATPRGGRKQPRESDGAERPVSRPSGNHPGGATQRPTSRPSSDQPSNVGSSRPGRTNEQRPSQEGGPRSSRTERKGTGSSEFED